MKLSVMSEIKMFDQIDHFTRARLVKDLPLTGDSPK